MDTRNFQIGDVVADQYEQRYRIIKFEENTSRSGSHTGLFGLWTKVYAVVLFEEERRDKFNETSFYLDYIEFVSRPDTAIMTADEYNDIWVAQETYEAII